MKRLIAALFAAALLLASAPAWAEGQGRKNLGFGHGFRHGQHILPHRFGGFVERPHFRQRDFGRFVERPHLRPHRFGGFVDRPNFRLDFFAPPRRGRHFMPRSGGHFQGRHFGGHRFRHRH